MVGSLISVTTPRKR